MTFINLLQLPSAVTLIYGCTVCQGSCQGICYGGCGGGNKGSKEEDPG
jgi:hypothetical protein